MKAGSGGECPSLTSVAASAAMALAALYSFQLPSCCTVFTFRAAAAPQRNTT
jgi:hypothetical protein